MLAIPELDRASVAFGDTKHMPKYDTLPADFKRHNGNDYCRAISGWFFSGARRIEDGIEIEKMKFVAKPGVDADKALTAIRACMASWEPKHEHKEAGCAFMLSEWFDKSAA
jgi:hypothetical protein